MVLACGREMDHQDVRPGMNAQYNGRSKKILRALKPPIEGAGAQRIGEIDTVLKTGGVVMHVDVVYTLGEAKEDENGEKVAKGETITRRVGFICNASNLVQV